ncbi:MAG: aminoglycoside adenylyltransferase domain-containing protein [Symbiobacteriia bacterium]
MDHSRLQASEYQAYAVLTMCRALYTLRLGTVAAKPVAARWAQDTFGRWRALIGRALAWRHGEPLDLLTETLGFIRFTLQSSEQTGGAEPDATEMEESPWA